MCGLTGIMSHDATAIVGNHMAAFMNMVWSGAARGMHGTGAFAVDKNGDSYRVRVGGPPHKLIESPEFDKFDKFVASHYVRALVGHNRYATKGGLDTSSAHPFRSKDGNILLVHNGTLDTFKHLPDAKLYDVDSEAICNAIAIQGVEKTVKTMKGAWALIWYDAKDKTINFLRNKERPLWIARHEKEPIMAWASELGMLSWSLNRNGMYLFKYEELPENQWYSFTLESSKPHVKEVKGAADTFFKDKYWQAWEERGDAVGTGKPKVEIDGKVLYLPPMRNASSNFSKPSDTTSTSGYNLGRATTQKKAVGNTNTDPGKGFWVAADDLHDIKKSGMVVVWPIDFRAIDTESARKDGIFQIKALSDDYPDIEFMCNVKGIASCEAIMDASAGMQGTVKSILRSMNTVSKFPHQIYLMDPVPQYNEAPDSIPDHAFGLNNGSGS